MRFNLYFKPYLQLQGSGTNKIRWKSQRRLTKEILITIINDNNHISKRLSRELEWDEYTYFWKCLLDGIHLDDICKELKITYDVREFLLF